MENQIKAKKSLGQNFLRDRNVLKKIADFADIKKEDSVVEVGPGEGTLTEILLERAGRVIAIEKDEQMVEFLREKFSKQITDNRLQIIEADILAYDLKPVDYKLIGNIPYYITGALFKRVLESENQPESITFVVQKEVTDRIMAKDGKESILSISIKAYGKPEYGGVIKAGSFYPVPKVDSAIISVRNISKSRFNNDLTPSPSPCEGEGRKRVIEKFFFEVLKAGFAHKRKLLIKNLGLIEKDKGKIKEIFTKLRIPEKARAEDLKVEDWMRLAQEFSPKNKEFKNNS